MPQIQCRGNIAAICNFDFQGEIYLSWSLLLCIDLASRYGKNQEVFTGPYISMQARPYMGCKARQEVLDVYISSSRPNLAYIEAQYSSLNTITLGVSRLVFSSSS